MNGDAGCGESGETGRVWVDDGGKPDRSAGKGKFPVDADVVTPESAGTAYGDVRDHGEITLEARSVSGRRGPDACHGEWCLVEFLSMKS